MKLKRLKTGTQNQSQAEVKVKIEVKFEVKDQEIQIKIISQSQIPVHGQKVKSRPLIMNFHRLKVGSYHIPSRSNI